MLLGYPRQVQNKKAVTHSQTARMLAEGETNTKVSVLVEMQYKIKVPESPGEVNPGTFTEGEVCCN
jgi:hypothetical protein